MGPPAGHCGRWARGSGPGPRPLAAAGGHGHRGGHHYSGPGPGGPGGLLLRGVTAAPMPRPSENLEESDPTRDPPPGPGLLSGRA